MNCNALRLIKIESNEILVEGKKYDGIIVYTGALDELFDNCYGNLPYRSLYFEWKHVDYESFQKYPLVAYPQAEGYTRITEYTKFTKDNFNGSTYAVEYPLQYEVKKGMEPYYPVLTERSNVQYQKYLLLSKKIRNLICCGRLADFKYYNMDQALERALLISKQIVEDIL